MLELRPQLQQLLTGSGVKVGSAQNVGQKTEDKNMGVPSSRMTKSAASAAASRTWPAILAAAAAAVLAA